MEYTVAELRSLASHVPLMRSRWDEIRTAICNDSEKYRGELVNPFHWSQAYEFDFKKHLTCLSILLGAGPTLIALASAENPLAAAIQLAENEQLTPIPEAPDDPLVKTQVFGLLFSLLRSIDSLCIHGKFLNELIQDVRTGSDLALFKAVKIDRAVLSCAPVADRIAWAEATDETVFFKKLSNALRCRPKKPKEEYAELRYVLYALEEVGALDSLSIERAYTLFCVELAIYPDEGPDPARKLWQFISRWKKARST